MIMSITNQYDIYYIVGKNIKKYRKQKGMHKSSKSRQYNRKIGGDRD